MAALAATTLMETATECRPLGVDPDAALLRQVGQGHQAAMRPLVERWQRPLVNFFYRSTQSFATAEDLAQITFVRVFRSASTYQAKAKFSTYLFHIARRLLINEYRRQSRKPLEAVDPNEVTETVSGRQPLELLELEEAFQEALKSLPENQRTALLLLKQQELSYDEIAETMEASLASVKSWIHRGRTKLKAEMAHLMA